jgi:hypothetical protein
MKCRQAIKELALTTGLMLILGGSACAQQPPASSIDAGTSQPPTLPAIAPPQSDLPPDLAQRQAKLLSESRQKQLVLDAQRLLTLANELKVAVDKSNKDTLSLDVIRKADEIEKLAHSVKEKMKGS